MKTNEELDREYRESAKRWGMTVETGPQVDCPDCHGHLTVQVERSRVSLWCKCCQRRAQMMTLTTVLLQTAFVMGREEAQADIRKALGIEDLP